jgi:hypothetical protein
MHFAHHVLVKQSTLGPVTVHKALKGTLSEEGTPAGTVQAQSVEMDMHGFTQSSGASSSPTRLESPPSRRTENQPMQTMLIIWRIIVNLAKQAWLLPKTIAVAIEQRRALAAGRVSETERLDRIRNPAKYAGR